MSKELVCEIMKGNPSSGVFIWEEDDGTIIADLTPFVMRLLTINNGWQPWTEERGSLFLVRGKKREEAKKVGEDINAEYGFQGMSMVHKSISKLLGGVAARELDFAWSGVGQWLA